MNPRVERSNVLLDDLRGVAFLEFLIVFVPMWTFALCIFQLALIAQANLLVRHAADAAARSAAVVLPDDAAEYGGEPQMSVGRNRIAGDDLARALQNLSSAVNASLPDHISSAFSGGTLGNVGRSRLNTIRLAAHVPLMPLAPTNVGADISPSLRKAVGGTRSLLSAFYYQPFAVAVTFPGAVGGIVAGPEVTVRVTYAYQCSVPLARQILCARFDQLPSDSDWEQVFFTVAQRVVGGHFRELQHESTVLVHSAAYEYRAAES